MIFVIRLAPMPGTDPIRALRAALKTLRRRYGLQAISAVQENSEIPAQQQESTRDDPGKGD